MAFVLYAYAHFEEKLMLEELLATISFAASGLAVWFWSDSIVLAGGVFLFGLAIIILSQRRG